MRRCKKCMEVFTGDQIADWTLAKEAYGIRPFICPACFRELEKMDVDERLQELERMRHGRW